MTEISYENWMVEGQRRFGEDFMNWRFECPVCHHVASVQDYQPFKDRGADANSATCECIGRYIPGSRKAFEETGKGPCDYAGYGLFRLSPVMVTAAPDIAPRHCFAFAPMD
jgi:hypothetical protein